MGIGGRGQMGSGQFTAGVGMSGKGDDLIAYCEMMMQKAPEYFNLITAKSSTEFEAAYLARWHS
jgi:hypothetical protein